MILLLAATLAAAACPDASTADASLCRAQAASEAGDPQGAALAFEQAAAATDSKDPSRARMLAAAGNLWIAAGQPGKAALDLDKALIGTGLQAEQRGEALLDRARAAEAQNDLKTARAKVTEATQIIYADPFLWYFSAALAIRENDAETAKFAISMALSHAPDDPSILFEAGHVAHFTGDLASARDMWSRAEKADPSGPIGKSAREALALLAAPSPAK
jgi:tetratricopeptide (TPR) repeat protein